MREFTLRAIVAGIVFGIVFGAANAYLGLRVGLTVSTSIPIAVLTVALFRLMRDGDVLLEANLSQTIGSASSSLATGTIFTIPALFLWGMAPPFWQVAILALLGGFLGIAAMVPLRRLLIVRSADELPYPEGTACAEVLRATTTAAAGGRWIFIGLAVGAAVKIALGAFVLIPSALSMTLPFLPKAEVALEIAPALLAVGYILGYRQSAIMVSGSLISAIVLTPLIAVYSSGPVAALTAGQIWSKHVRFIGAGAVAAAGLVAVARALPTTWSSCVSVVFVFLGWRDPSARAAILTVGTVVCIAASKAGDISQDLKTGYLVGATPARQQFGQFLGAAFACWAIAGTVLLLGKAFTFGSTELPAPQATLMKTVIEGVLAGSLPWPLVGTGAALAVCALIAGLPGLSFAVGIYLPLSTLAPVFAGGIVRRIVDARRTGKAAESDAGVLAASGMIAGEGLAGVAIAFLIAAGTKWTGLRDALKPIHFAAKDFTYLTGAPAVILGIATVLIVCALLFKAGRR